MNIVCCQCRATESILWRNGKNKDDQICNDCFEKEKSSEPQEEPVEKESTEIEETKKVRKSVRNTRYKSQVSKGKCSRRSIFKKVPFKTPKITKETTTKDSLFYEGTYYQIGDIVSLEDIKGNTYYAQIRNLMVDTYMEKSAVITWLIPTKSSPDPNEEFDPATYLIGPEEDIPRKLSYLQLVMSAPSNYYYDKTTPYPGSFEDDLYTQENKKGFIWTSL